MACVAHRYKRKRAKVQRQPWYCRGREGLVVVGANVKKNCMPESFFFWKKTEQNSLGKFRTKSR